MIQEIKLYYNSNGTIYKSNNRNKVSFLTDGSTINLYIYYQYDPSKEIPTSMSVHFIKGDNSQTDDLIMLYEGIEALDGYFWAKYSYEITEIENLTKVNKLNSTAYLTIVPLITNANSESLSLESVECQIRYGFGALIDNQEDINDKAIKLLNQISSNINTISSDLNKKIENIEVSQEGIGSVYVGSVLPGGEYTTWYDTNDIIDYESNTETNYVLTQQDEETYQYVNSPNSSSNALIIDSDDTDDTYVPVQGSN